MIWANSLHPNILEMIYAITMQYQNQPCCDFEKCGIRSNPNFWVWLVVSTYRKPFSLFVNRVWNKILFYGCLSNMQCKALLEFKFICVQYKELLYWEGDGNEEELFVVVVDEELDIEGGEAEEANDDFECLWIRMCWFKLSDRENRLLQLWYGHLKAIVCC